MSLQRFTACFILQQYFLIYSKYWISDKNAASTSKGCKRNPNSLRRVNLASLLGKHIQTQPVELEEANVSVINVVAEDLHLFQASIELQTLPKISRAIPFTSFKDGQQVQEELCSWVFIELLFCCCLWDLLLKGGQQKLMWLKNLW